MSEKKVYTKFPAKEDPKDFRYSLEEGAADLVRCKLCDRMVDSHKAFGLYNREDKLIKVCAHCYKKNYEVFKATAGCRFLDEQFEKAIEQYTNEEEETDD